MKKQFTHFLSAALILGGLSLANNAQAQDVFFIETMSTGSGTTNLDIDEAPFINDTTGSTVTFGGNIATSRTTSPSSGYADASGGRNIMINNNSAYFTINNIVISDITDINLSFGLRKGSNAETGANFLVTVIVDGDSTTFNPSLPYGTSGFTGWYLMSGNEIPTGDTLSLVFARTGGSTEFRLDDVTLTGVQAPLPVTLLSFSAQSQNNTNVFAWTTAQEKELSHFVLEGSQDAKTFTAVDQIKAYNNYSGATYSKSYAQSSNRFFRLKSVDLDGSFAYSKVVMVDAQAAAQVSLLNTLTQEQLTVSSPQSDISFKIFSMAGQLIQQGVLSEGVNSISVHQLPVGQYILHTESATMRFTKN